MNNKIIIAAVVIVVAIIAMVVLLKPIIYNEDKFKVVIANTSEHSITSVEITGAGTSSGKIGPIKVGNIQDYVFNPSQDGILHYSILQNNQKLSGVIKDLKKGAVGEVFIVIGEMYKVSIKDQFKI